MTEVEDRASYPLAHSIVAELIKQGLEIDNLGDNESVVILNKSPVINVMQLAEVIMYNPNHIDWQRIANAHARRFNRVSTELAKTIKERDALANELAELRVGRV